MTTKNTETNEENTVQAESDSVQRLVSASDITQQPQRQDSLSNQLHDLARVASKLGMYDAADFLARFYSR